MNDYEKELIFRLTTINLDYAMNDEEYGKLKGMKIAYTIALDEYRSFTCKMGKIPHISGSRCEACGFHTSETCPSYCSKCGRKVE